MYNKTNNKNKNENGKNMNTQKLLSYLRQCIKDYNMISKNDKIAVGLSGGKDSYTLLYGLKRLQHFYPDPYELVAIYVNLGIQDMKKEILDMEQYCKSIDVPFYVVDTEIYQIIFKQRKEKNPCSLCAKMRKGALNQKALSLHCNKIAYAHHKDDFIETSMMSLLFEGHYYCFPPVTHLDKTNLTLIRPMLYVEEHEIKGYIHKMGFPVIQNPCPADGLTKRQVVKEYIANSKNQFPDIKKNLYAALIDYYDKS